MDSTIREAIDAIVTHGRSLSEAAAEGETVASDGGVSYAAAQTLASSRRPEATAPYLSQRLLAYQEPAARTRTAR